MMELVTCNLTKTLKNTDKRLKKLKEKIEDVRIKYEQGEKTFTELMNYNAKKEYWQIYLMQENLKKEDTIFKTVDLKLIALTESINRGQQKGKQTDASFSIMPNLLLEKEEWRRIISISDYAYLKDVGKELSKEMSNINKKWNNDINLLKQFQTIVSIKNNPESLITKQDKKFDGVDLL